MLDRPGAAATAEQLTECRDCPVLLPPSVQDGAKSLGTASVIDDDQRRFPRRYVRGCAILEYGQTFPGLPRDRAQFKVCARDLSRGGISFYHSGQLYPKERLKITFLNGAAATIEIIRCLRHPNGCFEIGARFAEEAPAQSGDSPGGTGS